MTTNIIFPAPGAPNSFQLTDSFASCDLPSVFGKLSTYFNSPVETDSPTYISSQYNVAYNVADWYLSSVSNILKKTIRTPVITQTLYLNNTDNLGAILYRKDTNIKLTYLGNGFTKIVTIKESTPISITFDIFDGFPIVNTAGLRLVNVTTDLFPGTPIPSAPTTFPAPGSTSAQRWFYEFNTTTLPEVSPKLSWFDNVSTETDSPILINGQYNLGYNVVDWYIKDSAILSPSLKAVIDTQTLYFDNSQNGSIRYKKDQKIKISYDISGFSAIVQIRDASITSITFDLVNGFPTANQGALRLVNVTMEVYPRNVVQLDMIANGIPVNLTKARENLFASEYLPNFRGVRFSTNLGVAGVPQPLSYDKLEMLTDQALTGDKNFLITGQSIDLITINPNTTHWYTFDADVLTYGTSTVLVKTVYFQNQILVPFPTGSTIRLKNSLNNYSKTFTVALGTTNSVILATNDVFLTDGTYIDDFTRSVFPQENVFLSSTPTNPRENLYYFNLSPGLRSGVKNISVGFANNINSSVLEKVLTKLVADKSQLALTSMSKYKQGASQVFETPILSSLSKSIVKLKPVLTNTDFAHMSKQIISVKSLGELPLTTAISKLISSAKEVAPNPLTLSLLTKRLITVRSEPTKLSVTNLTKLTVSNTHVFKTPDLASTKINRIVRGNTIAFSTEAVNKLKHKIAALPELLNTDQLPPINYTGIGVYANTDYFIDQYAVFINGSPSRPCDYLAYSRIAARKYSIKTYNEVYEAASTINTENVSEATPVVIYAKMNPLGIPTGISTFPTANAKFALPSDPVNSYALSNFNNVTEGTPISVTGQLSVYDVAAWYIFDNAIIPSTTPSAGLTQTLTFISPSQGTVKYFYENNYVKIEQLSSGFSATVQLVSTTVFSITFPTVNGFPSNISGMTIVSVSNPVYSKALVASQLMPYGIVIQTTLPRENLYAAETLPNLRGFNYSIGNRAAGVTNVVQTNRLEVFQDTKITGDFKLLATRQTSDLVTATNNILQWYTFENNIILTTSLPATIKTLYFDTQLAVPYPNGTDVKISSGLMSINATVITGTVNSISFLQPTPILPMDNLYIERVTASVYLQSQVLTTVIPTNARENFYYSMLRPLNKSSAGLGSSTVTPANGVLFNSKVALRDTLVKMSSNSVTLKALVVKGEPNTLKVSSAAVSVKVASDRTTVVSGNLSKQVVKLTSDRKYVSTERATSTTFPTVIWYTDEIPVTGINGYNTNPSVAEWYQFDLNIILPITVTSNFITLYTGRTLYKGGDKIRVVQSYTGYNQVFEIVSSTVNSVTINAPREFPPISGMYFIWGRSSTQTDVTYTDANSVPQIKQVKQSQNQLVDIPTIGTLAKQLIKLTNDNAQLKQGTVAKQLLSLTSVKIGNYQSKESLALTTTPTVIWYNTLIYITGRTGFSTNPSIANVYTFDRNTFISTSVVSNYITLYFDPSTVTTTSDQVRIRNSSTSYDRTFVLVSSTVDSITIQDPGNLPSVSGLYFTWGRATSTTLVSYTANDSISIVNVFKTSVNRMLETPLVYSLTKQLTILKDVPVKLPSDSVKLKAIVVTGEPSKIKVSSASVSVKVTADQTVVTAGNLSKQVAKIVAVEKSYPSKSVATSVSTPTIIWGASEPITGIKGISTNPSIQRWYAFESNTFVTTTNLGSNITLYYGPTPYPLLGDKIRVVQPYVGYSETFTIISSTVNSVTFASPREFPPISGMYAVWGTSSTINSVTYTDTNQTPIVNKFAVKSFVETSVPQVSKVLLQTMLKGDSISYQVKPRLETFDNIGFTYDQPITAIQTIENTIPIIGRSPTYTTNVAAWYAYESNILKLTNLAPSATVTLYFGATTYTIGSSITLINYTTEYYRVFPVLSSTINSVTIATPGDLTSISNLHIYVNSTALFPSYITNGFGTYVKVASSIYNYAVSLPVVSSTSYSVTFVKYSFYDITVSANSYVTVTDASPSVYPGWQTSSATGHTPHDTYYKLLTRTLPTSVFVNDYNRSLAQDQTRLTTGKALSITKLTSVQNYISKTVSSVVSTPTVIWSDEILYISGRSGISTSPSIANWYTRDDLYNTLSTYDTMATTLTLYFPNTRNFKIDKIRVILPVESYDRVFDVIVSTTSSVTIAMPPAFPTISGMYMLVGTNSTVDTISYSNTNVIPIIIKSTLAKLAGASLVPLVNKIAPSLVVRSDNTPLLSKVLQLTKLKTPATNTAVFETPKLSSTRISTVLRADATPALNVSKLTQSTVVKGDSIAYYVKPRLEVFPNTKGIIENLTSVIASVDTAILISGRTKASLNDVTTWYAYESNILTITPLAVPENITLTFTNTTGKTIGSTVTLVKYDTGYFKTVNVISSTETSITIVNDNIPDSELYIYFGTTLSFMPQLSFIFQLNSTATISTLNGSTYPIQVTATTLSSISFVKTSAFITTDAGTVIYSSDPSYFPQSLVVANINRPPVNARENLMYGLLSPTYRSAKTYNAATTSNILSVSRGNINQQLFKLASDTSYQSREFKSLVTTPVIKWNTPVAIIGTNLNTANTAEWYAFEFDKLTTSLSASLNITLYFTDIEMPTTYNNISVRLIKDNRYEQTITLISNTKNSITFAKPIDFPSIAGMYMQWGFNALDSIVSYTDNNNVYGISRFKSRDYITVESPKSNPVSQLLRLVADTTTLKSNKVDRYTVLNNVILESPKVNFSTSRFVVKPDMNKLTLDTIPLRPDGTTLVDQRTVIVNTKPSNPRENLFYASMVSGKYGTSTGNKNLTEQLPLNFGRNESLTANPDLFPVYFPTGIVSLGLGVRLSAPNEQLFDLRFNPTPSALNNYYNVPTNVSVNLFNESKSGILDWLIFEFTNVISEVVDIVGATKTLYFSYEGVDKRFYTGHFVKIEQVNSNFSEIVEVIDSTLFSITINSIPNFPKGPIRIVSVTSPIYSKEYASLVLMPQGILRNTTLPRENLFAAENLPNTRGVSLFTTTVFSFINVTPGTDRLGVYNDDRIPGDFKIRVSLQSVDTTTTLTNTADWYANESDLLQYLTGVNSIKTLYFDNQSFAPFPSGSVVKITNYPYSIYATVIAGTANSITIPQPTELYVTDNLYIERSDASVYPQDLVVTIVPPTSPKENLYYSKIKPLDKAFRSAGEIAPLSVVVNAVNLPKTGIRGESNRFTVNSTVIAYKAKGEPTKLTVSKVLSNAKLTSIESYTSKEVSSTTSSSYVSWSTTPIYVNGVTGRSTLPKIENWYAFEELNDVLSVIDTSAAYVTLYINFVPMTVDSIYIRLMQPNSSYDRIFQIISFTADSVTIINPFDLPSISGMFFIWGNTINRTDVTFTDNNRTPRINILKSRSIPVFESPIWSTLSKQSVKLISDINKFTVNTGIKYTSVRADNSFLNSILAPKVETVAEKGIGTKIRFNDMTRIMVDSRGQVSKFITSNYHTIMNGDGVSTQKKETIQFWN
jgi:hypothetical protein